MYYIFIKKIKFILFIDYIKISILVKKVVERSKMRFLIMMRLGEFLDYYELR